MGSLTSRPSIPQIQQPVIFAVPPAPAAPAPAAPPPVSPPASGNTDGGAVPGDGAVPAGEDAQRLAREDNLLRRSRGRLGTVLTGFSGLLSQTVGQTARKTLLGE